MKIYLDFNVLISYLRSEIDPAFNMRGLDSERFFLYCEQKGLALVISELFLREVKKVVFLDSETALASLSRFELALERAANRNKQLAREISRGTGLHFSDARHAANAIGNNCDLLVSWNKRDFEKAKKLILCKTPLEFMEDSWPAHLFLSLSVPLSSFP